jgi:hypothetical protein
VVDRIFRGFRSPGDNSQFKVEFQNPIHKVSEEVDYGTFDDFKKFTNVIDKAVGLVKEMTIIEKCVHADGLYKSTDELNDKVRILKGKVGDKILIQCKKLVYFEELDLDKRMCYYCNGRLCKNGDCFDVGDHI